MSEISQPPTPESRPSPRSRAILATALLCLVGLVTVASLVSAQMEIDLVQKAIDGGFVTMTEAESNDQRQQMVGYGYLAAFVLSAIGFLMWIHRAATSLDAIGPVGEYSPGWAVGWWFVPIALLWKPYRVMQDIWSRCHPGDGGSKLMLAWWVLWLAGNLTGWLQSFGAGSTDLEYLVGMNRIGQVGNVLTLLSGLLVVVLIWQITNRIEARREGLAGGG